MIHKSCVGKRVWLKHNIHDWMYYNRKADTSAFYCRECWNCGLKQVQYKPLYDRGIWKNEDEIFTGPVAEWEEALYRGSVIVKEKT